MPNVLPVSYTHLTELRTVISSVAGAHHINDMESIQIGISLIKQYNRSVFTLPQAGRVCLIVKCQALDMILLQECDFLFSTGNN